MSYIGELPFHIGTMSGPNNPTQFPNRHQFNLNINKNYCVLEQVTDKKLLNLLNASYKHGIPIGTPSDATTMGTPYVKDFLIFIEQYLKNKSKVLEIGAGTGYLSNRLANLGHNVTSLEPGSGFKNDWVKNGVEVINDFYPSPKVQDKFNVMILYTVLEHVQNLGIFLDAAYEQLNENGILIISVPDCTEEINKCDPSILIHEHTYYFTPASLKRILEMYGFLTDTVNSIYGRSIYAAARKAPTNVSVLSSDEKVRLTKYVKSIKSKINECKKQIYQLTQKGSLAIYSPGRLLNVLPENSNYLFFDDSSDLQGMYYPPFNSIIQNPQLLSTINPTTLLVGSRTFAHKIISNLPPLLNTQILTIDQILK